MMLNRNQTELESRSLEKIAITDMAKSKSHITSGLISPADYENETKPGSKKVFFNSKSTHNLKRFPKKTGKNSYQFKKNKLNKSNIMIDLSNIKRKNPMGKKKHTAAAIFYKSNSKSGNFKLSPFTGRN